MGGEIHEREETMTNFKIIVAASLIAAMASHGMDTSGAVENKMLPTFHDFEYAPMIARTPKTRTHPLNPGRHKEKRQRKGRR